MTSPEKSIVWVKEEINKESHFTEEGVMGFFKLPFLFPSGLVM